MFLLELFSVLLGLIIGSFLNVCISRIPEGRIRRIPEFPLSEVPLLQSRSTIIFRSSASFF